MKHRYFLYMLISIILVVGACSQTDDENSTENDTEENDINDSEVESEESKDDKYNENGISDETEDYRSDIGNLNIWFEADVVIDEDKVTIEGESNLLPGTEISSNASNKSNWPVSDYNDYAEIQDDGTFEFEFPVLDYEVDMKLRVDTRADFVAEHYGKNLEKAEGNQVYQTNTIGEYESRYEFAIDPLEIDETPYTINLTTPDWESNVPSDYGDSNVWMDVTATTKHNYLYFDGESNLVEGVNISGSISDPRDLVSSAWSSSSARVNPDGSFQMKIHYWDLRDGMEMIFTFDPSNTVWEHVIDTYGEEGEELAGDLVKTFDDDSQYIELAVDLAGPKISAPEAVDLSMEEEEIKMQVPDDLLFDFDKSNLKSEATDALDEIINDLNGLPTDVQMEINGHTDNEGDADYNLGLSEERAHAVADYISDHIELDSITLDVQGFGETKPIASNEDEDGRQKNRRVEIVINPK